MKRQMNTIKNMMDKGQKLFENLYVEFQGEDIVSFNVIPSDSSLDLETVKSIVSDLKEQKMFTLQEDVPHMELGVSIERTTHFTKFPSYIIETFHVNLEDMDDSCLLFREYGFERNLNVPKPLHEFIGVDEPITTV